MRRTSLVVMEIVVGLQTLWLGMVLFIFRPGSFPVGMLLSIASWGMLVISLALFIKGISQAALCFAYIGIVTGISVFWTGGGTFEPGELLYRSAPNLIFLVAAHLRAKSTVRQVTT